ncbi:hypothetical protein ACFL56_02880 [Candidatus Margulisiibacteriota bacterium]
MDLVLFLTVAGILFSAITMIISKFQAKDKCMKDFNKFHVTIELKSGKTFWGELAVYSTGLEVKYREAHQDTDGHTEHSNILYNDELVDILMMYRNHDDLTEENQKRRLKDIKKTYKPGMFRRLRRKIRNWISILQDSVMNSVSLVAQKTAPNLQSQFSDLSNKIVTHAGNSFDPILERYIGKKVILEYYKKGENDELIKHELPGILKHYTDKYVEILDVHYPTKLRLPIEVEREQKVEKEKIEVELKGMVCKVKNKYPIPIYIKSAKGENYFQDLDSTIGSDATTQFNIDITPIPAKVDIEFEIVKSIDLVIPRAHSEIRHAGE